MIRVSSEAEMLELGAFFAEHLTDFPAVFELIGDVGAGKTTFTRGLARGLGVAEAVTSPSFTISKRYYFDKEAVNRLEDGSAAGTAEDQLAELVKNQQADRNGKRLSGEVAGRLTGELVHYDFYRLDDPGLMSDELAETLATPNAVVVIEWGGDVAELLPASKIQLRFQLNEDGSRNLKLNANAQAVENLWKSQANQCKTCVNHVENQQDDVEKAEFPVDKKSKTVENL